MKTTLLILTLITALLGCNEKNETPNCGCESETVLSIPNEQDKKRMSVEEQSTGWLYFKHPEIKDKYLNHTDYDNRFWIVQSGDFEKGRALIVCNQSILEKEAGHLRKDKAYDSLWVSFSGEAKKPCVVFVLPAVYGKSKYAEVTLKSFNIKN